MRLYEITGEARAIKKAIDLKYYAYVIDRTLMDEVLELLEQYQAHSDPDVRKHVDYYRDAVGRDFIRAP